MEMVDDLYTQLQQPSSKLTVRGDYGAVGRTATLYKAAKAYLSRWHQAARIHHCLPDYLPACLSVSQPMPAYLSACLPACLSLCQPVPVCAYLSVCLLACLLV